jgi:hypothetical protein
MTTGEPHVRTRLIHTRRKNMGDIEEGSMYNVIMVVSTIE